MNKKQLIVLWGMGIIISSLLIFYPPKYVVFMEHGKRAYIDKPTEIALPVTQWNVILPIIFAVLIIGGILIYTLNDKK
jgi:hypothetical protein